MSGRLQTLTLGEWDDAYRRLVSGGRKEPAYGGPLRRHLTDGDLRLEKLRFVPGVSRSALSPAAHGAAY